MGLSNYTPGTLPAVLERYDSPHIYWGDHYGEAMRGLGDIPAPVTHYASNSDIKLSFTIYGIKYGARVPENATTESIVEMLRQTLKHIRGENYELPLMEESNG